MLLGNLWREPLACLVKLRLYCFPLLGCLPHPKVCDITFGNMALISLLNLRPSLQSLGFINVPIFVKREGRVVLPVSGYHNFRDTFGSRHLREGAIPNT